MRKLVKLFAKVINLFLGGLSDSYLKFYLSFRNNSLKLLKIFIDVWMFNAVILPLQVTAPFLNVGVVLLMTVLSWPIALHFFRMNKKGKLLHTYFHSTLYC